MEPGVLSRTPLKIPHFSGGIQSGLLGCLLGFACALAFPLGLGGALVQVLALETCVALVAFGVLVVDAGFDDVEGCAYAGDDATGGLPQVFPPQLFEDIRESLLSDEREDAPLMRWTMVERARSGWKAKSRWTWSLSASMASTARPGDCAVCATDRRSASKTRGVRTCLLWKSLASSTVRAERRSGSLQRSGQT